MTDNSLMHEVMIEAFLDIEGDYVKDKSVKELLLAWVTWVDDRYKVASVPGVCYVVLDCDDGEVVSVFNNTLPDAKEQARNICETLNGNHEQNQELSSDTAKEMLDPDQVADAFLNMDEESFMDFLLGIQSLIKFIKP